MGSSKSCDYKKKERVLNREYYFARHFMNIDRFMGTHSTYIRF